jgi:DNA-binding transcriptional LysR family regulator
MTLEQLRIFVAVANELHVTNAARALRLTQSAASAAIAALEARHSVSLFHRIGRRVELTEAGRLFLAEATAVLKRAADAETALNELAHLLRGSLSVHASQTIANYWLPVVLHQFRQRYPKVTIGLTIGNTEQVARAVVDGDAQLGFVEGKVTDPAVVRKTIGQDELALVVGARHALAHRKTLQPSMFHKMDWVLRERGSGTRSEFDSALKPFGLTIDQLRVVLELPSNEAVRSAVEAGAGATVISLLVADAGLRSGTLRQIPMKLPARPFYMLRHAERRPSRAASALLELLDTIRCGGAHIASLQGVSAGRSANKSQD